MTTITPKYINDPKPGKKMYSVKDDGGNLYLCYDNIARQLTEGTAIEVVTEPASWNNEMTIIKGIAGAPASGPQQSAAAALPVRTQAANKDRLIVLQTIVKACGSHSGSSEEADMWLRWIKKNMRSDPAPNTTPEPPRQEMVDPPPCDTEPDLNGEIPF